MESSSVHVRRQSREGKQGEEEYAEGEMNVFVIVKSSDKSVREGQSGSNQESEEFHAVGRDCGAADQTHNNIT